MSVTAKPGFKPTRIKRAKGDIAFTVVNTLCMVLFCLAILYPVLNVVSVSLSKDSYVYSGAVTFYPKGFQTQSYKTVLTSYSLWRSFANSIFVSVVGTLLTLIFTSLAAYPLAFARFYGKRLYTFMIMLTMWFGGGMIPTFLVVQGLGMVDTFWALIIPGLMSAYNMFILRNYFQQLPPELEESAYIDGATPPVALLFIILPISAPSLAAIAMFYAVGNWNSYLDCLLYTNSGDLQVLQIYLRNLIDSAGAMDSIASISGKETSQLSAETVKMTTIAVSIIPILIIYPFLQRFYTKGITVGAVKG